MVPMELPVEFTCNMAASLPHSQKGNSRLYVYEMFRIPGFNCFEVRKIEIAFFRDVNFNRSEQILLFLDYQMT